MNGCLGRCLGIESCTLGYFSMKFLYDRRFFLYAMFVFQSSCVWVL